MSRVSKDLLKEAFLKPIRSALLLDDQFPTYTGLCSQLTTRQEKETDPVSANSTVRLPQEWDNSKGEHLKGDGSEAEIVTEEQSPTEPPTTLSSDLDLERALSLVKLCRSQGWLCDLDNGSEPGENELARINQCDLLVLDYHLEAARPSDATRALKTIQDLAASEHFNLVIVYTAYQAADALAEIAFGLGAGTSPESKETCDSEIDHEEFSEHFTESVRGEYLAGKVKASGQSLRSKLRAASCTASIEDCLNYICYSHLARKIGDEAEGARQDASKFIKSSFGTSSAAPQWVTLKNVFVVVVNKTEEPRMLLDLLLDALQAWDPSPLHVMMIHARSALVKSGHLQDQQVLQEPVQQAAWLFRLLSAEEPLQINRRLEELYGRLFDRLTAKSINSIKDFGNKVVSAGRFAPAIEIAEKWSGLNVSPVEKCRLHVNHALNVFLSSEPFDESHITTGVIFSSHCADRECYWLCTTPACDLVPGQNRNGWEGTLELWRPLVAARLTTSSIEAANSQATRCRQIFLWKGPANPLTLQVSDDNSRQMNLESILVENDGAVENGRFRGKLLRIQGGQPVLRDTEFTVIAKLRSDYAGRYLVESGNQRARLGIDFVDYAKPDHQNMMSLIANWSNKKLTNHTVCPGPPHGDQG